MADQAPPPALPEPRACARCVEWLHSPQVAGYSNTGPTAHKASADTLYPRGAAAALRLLADGYQLRHPDGSDVELVAVTTVDGTLLCGRHTSQALNIRPVPPQQYPYTMTGRDRRYG